LRLADYRDIYLFFVWVIFGFFYLLFYGVSLDMYYFVKILKNYKLEDDLKTQMEEDDADDDKIVIFNEMIFVMKSILFLF
jgi:hypothetical protein